MRFRGYPTSGPTKPVEFVPTSGIPKSTESGDSPTSGFLTDKGEDFPTSGTSQEVWPQRHQQVDLEDLTVPGL